MERFNFTQSRVRALPVPTDGRTEYADKEIPKLRLRITPAGTRSFGLLKNVNGRARRVTLGRFPDISVGQARKLALNALRDIAAGIDPVEEKRRLRAEGLTLGKIRDDYLQTHTLKPVTRADYRHRIDLAFEDWIDRPINRITTDMVRARHRELTRRGKTTANSSFRVLRALMRHARAIDAIQELPTDVLSSARLWHKPRRAERIIPADSLGDWYRAVLAESNPVARVYLLTALHMGLRGSELARPATREIPARGLRWEDVDLEGRLLTLRDTKNGSDCALPVPGALVEHFDSLIPRRKGYVFADRDGKPIWTPAKAMARVTEACGVKFCRHDLRRTFATIAEVAGVPHTTIKKLLNHVTDNEVTGGYIRTEVSTMRAATEQISAFILDQVQ
ncbi:MAG: site-specific integrase [Pseudomonadota bacterium]|nr:site-specific integrase [Pseudomonadota bacterium]